MPELNTTDVQNVATLPVEQTPIQLSNPYNTFFTPLSPGERPRPGDLITFIYNKALGPYRGQIHDREPLVLILDQKKKQPDRFQGINIHYLTNNNVSSIVEMANRKQIISYDQMKAINIQWADFFRSYLFAWVQPGSMKKINKQDVQMETEIIRQTGLRNLETIKEMVEQKLQQEKTQQKATDMAERQPITSKLPIPGTLPIPAMGANARPADNLLNTAR